MLMADRLLIPFRLFLAFIVALALAVPAMAQQEAEIFKGRVIVLFHSQSLPADAAARVQAAGGRVLESWNPIGGLVAEPAGVSGDTFIQNLRKDPAIFNADYDRILTQPDDVQVVEADGGVSPQGHIPPPAIPPDAFYPGANHWSVKRVGGSGGGVPGGPATGAWDMTFGAGVRIAILDGGVSPIHPDTVPNLVFNASFATTPLRPTVGVCDDGSPVDQTGHGTWTSTIAAGALGFGGVIGVAPQASILNIKVLRREPRTAATTPDTPFERCRRGSGSGLFSWTISGMLLAAQQGADVINMSLGGFVPKAGNGLFWATMVRVTNFLDNNGVVVVASAGNSAVDVDGIASFEHLPSNLPNVIAVTATTNPAELHANCAAGADCLASYSNYGSSLHGLAAPGGDLPLNGAGTGFVLGGCGTGIPGTIVGLPATGGSFGCFTFSTAQQHSVFYVLATGTSASAPHVAGAAALIKAAKPWLSPSQIRILMQQTAEDIGKMGYDQFFNFGLVCAAAAVQ
jgi:subtilisin family serine protease